MKNQVSFILSLAIAFTLLFTACEKEDPIMPDSGSILPDKFSVEIPAGLSQQSSLKKSTEEVDTLNGNVIYRHLRTFIRSGEMGAEIVEGIIRHIVVFNINEPVSLSYESDEDGRTKNLEVIENSYYDGVKWEFQLSITDAL